jgi:hypothetical protein
MWWNGSSMGELDLFMFEDSTIRVECQIYFGVNGKMWGEDEERLIS